MKRTILLSSLLIGSALVANAGVHVSISIGTPAPRPVIVSQPAPVIVQPAPQVVYSQPVAAYPAPGVCATTPVVAAAPVVVAAPPRVVVGAPVYVPAPPVYTHSFRGARHWDSRHHRSGYTAAHGWHR